MITSSTDRDNTDGIIQSYVLLTADQIKKIRDLFEISERDDISHSIQVIVEEYISEHTREDVKKLQANATWDDFTNKFNEGWFAGRNQG